MKILKVIHGYPDRYNAGSEVYSQTLCHSLIKRGHDVTVFARHEDPYQQEYRVHWEQDRLCPEIKLCLINMAQSRDGYQHQQVDQAFNHLLQEYRPDLVHFGHLSHLSTSIVEVAHQAKLPLVFTLHDFWLMCPRGQFLQTINTKGEELYPVCHSQEDEKCSRTCYWRHFSSQEDEEDAAYWTHWVSKRMAHIRQMSSYIDMFIAPSMYLLERFVKDFPIDRTKVTYLDYGFDLDRLKNRKRLPEKEFVFGYIGTHKQAKGILHLLNAFAEQPEGAALRIWGSSLSSFTNSLKDIVKTFKKDIQNRISWMGGYRNEKIVEEVFNHCDAIVVPSIWGENSPLVIHEALEAGVPVITADYGGMKEYIHHEVNGLLFRHRDEKSLVEQMKRFVQDPGFALQLAKRKYLQSEDCHIPNIIDHAEQMESLYLQLMKLKKRL
ncbi:MAG: glycosyltransferase [Chlamydiales bacterium]